MSETEDLQVHQKIVAVLKQIKFGKPILVARKSSLPITHSNESSGYDYQFDPVTKSDPVKKEEIPHQLVLNLGDIVIPIRPQGQHFGTVCVAEVRTKEKTFQVFVEGEDLIELIRVQGAAAIKWRIHPKTGATVGRDGLDANGRYFDEPEP